MTQTLDLYSSAFPLQQAKVKARVTGNISGMEIKDIVQQALTTGYLSVADENQLRQLLQQKLNADDLNAFWTLQNAVMTGCVKQQSRELPHITGIN